MRNIAVLGSTGSVGTQTLDVVRQNKDLRIISLSAANNIKLLEQQIREFLPKFVCVWNEKRAKELKIQIKDLNIPVLTGMDGLIACAVSEEVDLVVTALVGMIGIIPSLEAIKAGKSIALANKETLVAAGHLIMPLAKQHQVNILPVDSEHSAIFQVLNGENKKQVNKILLTASGGPFRGKNRSELEQVRIEDALKHPNWSMGKKITIDSATMANKGLEVIEAKWLFDVSMDQIQVVIQPQSIIHSMVEFIDGSVIAQLGTPDMRLPIQYALFYPERRCLEGDRLDFYKLSQLTFAEPDFKTFSCLALAFEAGRRGGSMPAAYNAANEYAVSKFLNHEIGFLDIMDLVAYAVDEHKFIENPTLNEILETERITYDLIECKLQQRRLL